MGRIEVQLNLTVDYRFLITKRFIVNIFSIKSFQRYDDGNWGNWDRGKNKRALSSSYDSGYPKCDLFFQYFIHIFYGITIYRTQDVYYLDMLTFFVKFQNGFVPSLPWLVTPSTFLPWFSCVVDVLVVSFEKMAMRAIKHLHLNEGSFEHKTLARISNI